nr:MAG TPA: holin [Caudoviricetes sp.]
MKLTNRTYDILKWIALILLPALATFYAAIAAVWGLPYTEQVVGTITAVDTLLGTLLKISADKYAAKA